jgi:hypothetical protein
MFRASFTFPFKNNKKKFIKNSQLLSKPHNGAGTHQFAARFNRQNTGW